MDEPEDRARIAAETSLVWLSTDSLINQATLDRLGDRVAIKHFSDGLILGEAATALWLTSDASSGTARLTLYPEPLANLTASDARLAAVQPYRHGLVTHLDQSLDQQANWHQWLGDFEPASEFDALQHASLTSGFGYVGAAGRAWPSYVPWGAGKCPAHPLILNGCFTSRRTSDTPC